VDHCNSSFEIVVFDLDQKKVTERIPMPKRAARTPPGAFVQYDGWNGQYFSDHTAARGAWRRSASCSADFHGGSLGNDGKM